MKKHSKFLEKWNPDKYNTNHLSDLLCTPYVPNLSHHFTLKTKSLGMVFSQIICQLWFSLKLLTGMHPRIFKREGRGQNYFHLPLPIE